MYSSADGLVSCWITWIQTEHPWQPTKSHFLIMLPGIYKLVTGSRMVLPLPAVFQTGACKSVAFKAFDLLIHGCQYVDHRVLYCICYNTITTAYQLFNYSYCSERTVAQGFYNQPKLNQKLKTNLLGSIHTFSST